MKISKMKWWLIGLIILVLLIMVWLVFLGGFMYTPQIGGKVIDAETGTPIAEVNLKVSWEGSTRVIIDTVHTTYEKGFYQSTDKGDFMIPAYRRLIFPFFQAYDRQDIFVYAHGYKPEIIKRYPDGKARLSLSGYPDKEVGVSSSSTTIRLKPLQIDEEWISNIRFLESGQFGLKNEIPKGIEFLVKDCEIFVERFPSSPFAPGILLKSAQIYQGIRRDYPKYNDLAIRQYQKVIERFPQSKEANNAERSIQYIKENPPDN
jgi:hypothetical protein